MNLSYQNIGLAIAGYFEAFLVLNLEYMDCCRNPDPTPVQFLLDSYHHKFSNQRIDLVIAYSAPALSLVIAHGNDHFAQTPIVFSGILREQFKGLNLSPIVTGVLADIDYAGLLETALKIHPQTRHVAIVNGASKTDLLFEKEFSECVLESIGKVLGVDRVSVFGISEEGRGWCRVSAVRLMVCAMRPRRNA